MAMIYFSRLHFIQNARNAQALEFDATSNPRCKNHTGCRPAKRRPHCSVCHPCRCHGNYPCHTGSHPFCRWASAFANIDRDPHCTSLRGPVPTLRTKRTPAEGDISCVDVSLYGRSIDTMDYVHQVKILCLDSPLRGQHIQTRTLGHK